MGEVAKYFKKYNIVTVKEDNEVPRSCEYYLHFDINLPYPEQELKNCIANEIWKKSYKKKKNRAPTKLGRPRQKHGSSNKLLFG